MPYPASWLDRGVVVLIGLGAAAAGAWVLISPPRSYEALGALLTTAWGALLLVGGVLVAAAWAARSYKLELPGIVPVLGGLAIYAVLSWQQTLGDSLGSGPRALLITAGALIALYRLKQLIRASHRARWAAEVRTE